MEHQRAYSSNRETGHAFWKTGLGQGRCAGQEMKEREMKPAVSTFLKITFST